MEAIIAALITGAMTLIGVIIANSKHSAVIEERITNLKEEVEKHNSVIERTYVLESKVAVLENEVRNIRQI